MRCRVFQKFDLIVGAGDNTTLPKNDGTNGNFAFLRGQIGLRKSETHAGFICIDGNRLVVGGILRHQESVSSLGNDLGSESMAVMIFIISEGEVASRRSWTRDVSAQRMQIR